MEKVIKNNKKRIISKSKFIVKIKVKPNLEHPDSGDGYLNEMVESGNILDMPPVINILVNISQ